MVTVMVMETPLLREAKTVSSTTQSDTYRVQRESKD